MNDRQRHTHRNPCPLCDGYDTMPRGQGVRCHGWTDGIWTHCGRDELAGRLPQEAGGTYCHKMEGDCRCGVEHGSRPVPLALRPLQPRAERRHEDRKRADDWRPTAIYLYLDEERRPLFQVCRLGDGAKKTFRQRQPRNEGGWWADLEGARRVLYRLPELLAADPEALVFVCEGEKDVDRLRSLGLVATCNPMGAGKWSDTYAPVLAGRHVVVLVDNDQAGSDHGEQVARSLQGVAASVKVVRLPDLPPKGDVSDWLDQGNTPEELLRWVQVWPLWLPPAVVAELAKLRRDLDAANDTLREHRALTALDRNRAMRQAKPAVLAIAYDLRNRESAGRVSERGTVELSLKGLEAEWHVSRNTLSDHLTILEDAGVIADRKATRRPVIDADGQLVRDARGKEQWTGCVTVRPVTTDPLAFLEAVARARAPERGWGGKREACPHCGADLAETGTVTAWQRYCAGCGELVNEGKQLSRKQRRQERQDAALEPDAGEESVEVHSSTSSTEEAAAQKPISDLAPLAPAPPVRQERQDAALEPDVRATLTTRRCPRHGTEYDPRVWHCSRCAEAAAAGVLTQALPPPPEPADPPVSPGEAAWMLTHPHPTAPAPGDCPCCKTYTWMDPRDGGICRTCASWQPRTGTDGGD